MAAHVNQQKMCSNVSEANHSLGKEEKIMKIKHLLTRNLSFLQNYLPFANSHSKDFITHKHWENFLPEEIRSELLSLTDENLLTLPHSTKTDEDFLTQAQGTKADQDHLTQPHSTKADEDLTQLQITKADEDLLMQPHSIKADENLTLPHSSKAEKDLFTQPQSTKADEDHLTQPQSTCTKANDDYKENVQVQDEWKFECDYFIKSPKLGQKCDIYSKEMKHYRPKWIHSNISLFVSEAQKHALHMSGILSGWSDLASRLSQSGDKEVVFISQYMDKKKSHEVEVMGDVCATLSKAENIDVVIDLGSGKGYLSTHLALQHKLTVLGVDAQTTNTAGASRRREVLTKQWAGLTRNAKIKNEKGDDKKLGKKLKKKMRKLQEEGAGEENFKDCEKVTGDVQVVEVNEEVVFSVGNLFLDSDSKDFLPDESVDHDVNSTMSQEKGDKKRKQYGPTEKNNFCSGDKIGNCSKSEKVNDGQKDIVTQYDVRSSKTSKHHFPVTLYIDRDTNLIEIIEQTLAANNCELPFRPQEGDKANNHDLSVNPQRGNMVNNHDLPVRPERRGMTNNPDLHVESNREDILNKHNPPVKCHREDIAVMMTGLHTCGGLGASTMRLFVSCDQGRVLCNVGCCYHLMEEEFVANPYTEHIPEKVEEQPGFPLSSFLQYHRVGLGKFARSFASQAVTRRQQDTKLIAKQFPRIVLQAVLSDILGFTSEEWKGLRKLDQKCKDLPEYIQRAVKKLNLPADQFSEERIQECLDKYAVYKERFIAYFQLKLVLAPCIEAVVLLDRMLYLLEQDCIEDAMLVQMFDPVKSPRCHGIIAFKKANHRDIQ